MRTHVTGRALAGLTAGLLVIALLPAAASPAAAAVSGPSVPLPGTASTPVTQQNLTTRTPDQASTEALTGNQPDKPAKDGAGTSHASSLSPSATWRVSTQTGDFTWSYPLRVPAAPGGSEPKLALSYASSSVDGRTSATNNQASWIADGWDLSPGFVERTYGGCAEDDLGGTTPPKTGDLCWRSDNAVASYSGGGGQLIHDASGDWRAKDDDGSRIERLTGADNGDNDGEYWKITAVDGTQYFFGSQAASKSAWTVPVFGDDSGEPCHATTFAASHCVQGWRWNLDKVVDRHGNLTVYSYDTETNAYGLNLKDDAVSYVRAGTLKRIEYGLRDGDPDVPATGRVDFATAPRCVPGSDCTPEKKDNWPDVPWEDKCDTATCKDKYSPSFWSTRRLARITTQIRRGGSYTDVDSWTLDQQFPNPGDGEKAAMWLKSITHTGHLGGGEIALPAVTFEGSKFPNRVYKVGDGLAPLNRYRITGIVSESGGLTTVKYADPDCTGTSLPANAESNTMRCFPARWAKKDYAERTDYFQKYVVAQVTQSDRISSSAEQVTSYEYLDGAAWHYDQSEFVKDDKKTWNDFRGFGRVRTRTGQTGDPAGPPSLSEERFYRGMDGDKQPHGTRSVSVPDSEGGSQPDADWLAGQIRETTTYNGDAVISKQLTTPVTQGPTATRGELKAYLVRAGKTQTSTAIRGGGWRTTASESTYDDRGILTRTSDLGDTSTAADDTCTTSTFARNTGAWVLSLPWRAEKVGVACGATPQFPADAISDVRTSYDGQPPGTPPSRGDVTKAEVLTGRPVSGPVYTTAATTKYDAHGRATETTDALGRTSKTAYTPALGGPVTAVVTADALGHPTTSILEPGNGQPLTVTDENARVTETAYDALGRVAELWMPNRSRAGGQRGNARYEYLIRDDGPAVVTETSIGPNGNYKTSRTLYDGLLRPRQVQAPAAGGGRLLTDTRYDSQGRVYKATQPYFNDAPVDGTLWVAADTEVASLTRTEYDGAGRATAQITYGGAKELWRVSTAYGGDRVDITPPGGATATTAIADARGQTVEQRQYHGGTPTGDYDRTTYTYTKSGQLASVTDPGGSTWRNTYDLRGNRIKADDADKGTSVLTYDDAGQVTSETDARGITLAYTYDPLGRRTAVRNGEATLAEWTYDTAVKGKGQLASSTRYSGGAAYTSRIVSYTALDQPSESAVVIPETEETLAGTYTSYAKYNPDGSPASSTLPAIGDLAAEDVSHQYDDLGHPLTTSGALDGSATQEYVTGTEYTRYGEAARVQLGEDGKRVWQSFYYDASTRRLDRSIVDAEVPRPMQTDVHYTYDPAGNVTSIADTPRDKPADVQCFTYDYLQRLTGAWTPGDGCAASPDSGQLAGPAPYRQSFTYDIAGNRLTETDQAGSVRTYSYAGHRLESVAGPGRTGTYGYDAAGHTTARAGQQLTWDAAGKLAKVAEGAASTEFVYDADGDRLIRRDPTGRTLYLDGQELRLDKATGKLTATRYYQHGGDTVAMRTGAGVTWLASDHEDTSQLAIDRTGQQVTQRRQTPFGGPRGAAVAFPGEKGFVGGTKDASTGLTHLGAREYDPSTGRFLSVDPVMDLSDPQQLHGYTYGNNNPVTHVDPTGLSWGSFWGGVWNGVKNVAKAVTTVTKYAAPILGGIAIAATVAAAVFVALPALATIAAVATTAGMVVGAVNAINACTGGGSGVDCGMEIAGMIPGAGRIIKGAGALLRTGVKLGAERLVNKVVTVAGNAADRYGVLNGGGVRYWSNTRELHARLDDTWIRVRLGQNPHQWLDNVGLSKPMEIADTALLAANTSWSACGLGTFSKPLDGNCMGVPTWQPFKGPVSPLVYPSNFIGPVPRGALRNGPPIPVHRPQPAAPGPPASSPGRTYTTSDGRVCNTAGGRCAI